MSVDKMRLAQRVASLPATAQQRFIGELQQRGLDFASLPIPRRGQDQASLSHAQQRLWFLWQLDRTSSLYNIPRAIRLRGILDVGALGRVFDVLVARHESLRTTFHEHGDGAVQRIHAPFAMPVRAETVSESALTQIADEEAAAPFDLERGPLLRVRLLRLGEDDHVLLLTMHHIISDGWSMGIIIDEFAALYAAHAAGTPAQLPDPDVQYADYAAWQGNWLDAGERDRQLGYWCAALGDKAITLELPTDRPRPAVPSHRGGFVTFSLDTALAGRLRALARQADTTLFSVLLAAFQILLYRYTAQHDIRVGVPVANRNRAETARTVGLFVNTQVLRADVHGALRAGTLLRQVRDAVQQAQAHQELPFEQLVEALQPERSLSHNPLFQVMLNHQRRDLRALQHLPGLTLGKVARTASTAKVDLALDTQEDEHGAIDGVFGYATDLFEPATIERLQRHYVAVLAQIAEDPARRIADLVLEAPCPDDADTRHSQAPLVHLAIARQASLRPHAVAVRGGGGGGDVLTYAELDQAADRLAAALTARISGLEPVVGVVIDRTPAMIVRLLAVLKAGAAYVPIDPELPPARIAQMTDGARVQLLLASRRLRHRVQSPLPVFEMEDAGDVTVSLPCVLPAQLAYLIYTSGSTGTPKAVAVEHGPLAMHCHATAEQYGMAPGERELHFLAFSFDGAHERWMTPLVAGAEVVLRDDELWSAEQTLDAFARYRITNAGFPPAYLARLAEAATPGTPPLRLLSFGGEAISRETFTRVRQALRVQTLINGYGPTEAIVTPLAWLANARTPCPSAYAPIGRPVGARHAYVLDADLNPVPQGAIGELHIGGLGLARGYAGHPAMTAERFLPDPFVPGARIYRTGDLVRQAACGHYEYVARRDHQIKIRGYRIEPGEIEARLRACPGVREAAVIALETPTGLQLAAYVSGQNDAAALRRQLEATLPAYMVPAHVIALEHLPLTANGKLNRHALPAPACEAPGQAEPQTPTEAALARVWQEVLGLPHIGVTDNFFELGGDSILSIQAVSRARAAGLRFTPKDLFLHQTVRALAQAATSITTTAGQPEPTGEVPLLPIQRTFFEADIPQRHHWNQAVLLHPREPLDPARLARAIDRIAAHHDALRLRFSRHDGQWTQHYTAHIAGQDLLWLADVENETALATECTRAQQSLDLEAGPLLRALLCTLPGGSQRLLLAIHHLVIDGVSWRILLEDLQHAYRNDTPLPPRTSSYQCWAKALQQYATSEAIANEAKYWRDLPQPPPPVPDHDIPPLGCDAASETVHLDPQRTAQLLQDAHSTYRTRINDLLLAALARAAGQWLGQDRVGIVLEGHGREALFDGIDCTRTLGWFTTVYPVVLPVGADLGDGIRQVKETLRAVPAQGVGYGALRHLGDQTVRHELAGKPLPRITFNYLGRFDALSQSDALFAQAAESPGAGRSAAAPLGNWITINGQVSGGMLELRIGYSRRQFTSMQPLAKALQEALEVIVDHCADADHASMTPSDLVNITMDQASLDALLDAVL